MYRIWHNSLSPIQCIRAFHILFFAYLLYRCYCYNHYKTQKYYFCYRYRYFHTILLLNTLLQILSYPGVVELTTQLLILKDTLWLPLCRINIFRLNTLPSKAIAIPYTCGLSRLISDAVAGDVGGWVRHMPKDGLSWWGRVERRRCPETEWGEDMHAGGSYPASGLSEEITPLLLLCGASAWSLRQNEYKVAPRAVFWR